MNWNLSDLSRSAVRIARLVQSLPPGEHVIHVRKTTLGMRWEMDTPPRVAAAPQGATQLLDLTLDNAPER